MRLLLLAGFALAAGTSLMAAGGPPELANASGYRVRALRNSYAPAGEQDAAPSASGAAGSNLVIRIHLIDYYGVDAAVRRRAQVTVARVLRKIGMSTEWTVCAQDHGQAACNVSLGTQDVVCRLAAGPNGPELDHDALGAAAVVLHGGGVLATVYPDRVQRFVGVSPLDEGTVLGYAIAHEMGHLILGTDTDDGTDIMRPHWTSAEIERPFGMYWTFDRQNARDVRVRWAERVAALYAVR